MLLNILRWWYYMTPRLGAVAFTVLWGEMSYQIVMLNALSYKAGRAIQLRSHPGDHELWHMEVLEGVPSVSTQCPETIWALGVTEIMVECSLFILHHLGWAPLNHVACVRWYLVKLGVNKGWSVLGPPGKRASEISTWRETWKAPTLSWVLWL